MIDRILFQTLGKAGKISSKGQHFTFNCPRCAQLHNGGSADNRFNLEISINKIINGKRQNKFHCWKCDFKGDPLFLVKKYGSKENVQQYQQYLKDFFFIDKEDVKQYSLRLPKEFISVTDADLTHPTHKRAMDYLCKTRNIDMETLVKFNVGFAIHGYYRNRIIIPSYDENRQLNYFVGRSFAEGDEEATEKYRNPTVNKNTIIFNECFIDWYSPVFLTEGAFELLAMPINNIVMLGKILPDLLLEKLVYYNCKVIVALNMDAFGNTKERNLEWRASTNSTVSIIRKLKAAGLKDVKFLNMPENDLGNIIQKSNKNGIFAALRDNVEEAF